MKEYKVVQLGGGITEPIEIRLNELANEGWVLVQVIPTLDGGYTTGARHYFERDIPEVTPGVVVIQEFEQEIK